MEEGEHLPATPAAGFNEAAAARVGGAAWAQPPSATLQLLPSRNVCIYCCLMPSGSLCFLLRRYKEHLRVRPFISMQNFIGVCFLRSQVRRCL